MSSRLVQVAPLVALLSVVAGTAVGAGAALVGGPLVWSVLVVAGLVVVQVALGVYAVAGALWGRWSYTGSALLAAVPAWLVAVVELVGGSGARAAVVFAVVAVWLCLVQRTARAGGAA